MSAESERAGYSKRPLAEKLGIKAGMRVAAVWSGLKFVYRLKDR